MTGLPHLDAGPTVFFPLEVTLVSIMFASSSLVLIGLIFSDDFSPLMGPRALIPHWEATMLGDSLYEHHRVETVSLVDAKGLNGKAVALARKLRGDPQGGK